MKAMVKAFEDIAAGDMGYYYAEKEYRPIVFLGKGIGRAGFKALEAEFGNVSGLSFDDITDNFTEEEIEASEFVAFKNEENIAQIDLYGIYGDIIEDVIAVTEYDENLFLPFEKVESGDTGLKDDRAFKVYSTGKGRTWFDEIVQSQNLSLNFDEVTGGDDDVNLVYGAFAFSPPSIEVYGQSGVKVFFTSYFEIDDNGKISRSY
jgi:hypothetical protein